MPKQYEEVKELYPRLQGLVDARVEREIFLAFHRIYDYLNNELASLTNKIDEESRSRTTEIVKQTSELLNNFATKLVGKGQGNSGNNPLQILGSGTVTSVNANGNILFVVLGGPITESGTLSFTLSNQNANLIFAGPTTGAAAVPSFRAIVKEDINIPFRLTTSTNADPTVAEYDNDEWGIHRNTTSGDIFITFNDGGVIKKLLLV